MKTILAINGAAGRMGQRLVVLSQEDPNLQLGFALEFTGNPRLNQDAGEVAGLGKIGVPLTSEIPLNAPVDVVIDFSTPEGTMAILPTCQARRLPIIVATTGFSAEQKQKVEAAAHETAVLMAPNMSLAVNVLFELTRQTARLLAGKGFDVEIIERHHRFKKDAPSGTAMHFARIVQEQMGQERFVYGREGITGERPANEIGLHALRVGDNVGEHTIVFSTLGETLELVHKGHTRDSYARGALLAAKFLAGKPPGRYHMKDVLGL